MALPALLNEIRGCKLCAAHLPLGPNPVFSVSAQAKLLIVGQAPGAKVHESGVPWDDASGRLLREWLGVNDHLFYDKAKLALVPMGFCYPGKGPSGDMPPRPECAPLWHAALLEHLKKIELTLLVGRYAQAFYLGEKQGVNLTATVRNFKTYLPRFLPLPHPSPRNRIWLRKNEWFDKELLPVLRKITGDLFNPEPPDR